MKPEIKTQRYFTCPCGAPHRHVVEHLITQDRTVRAGPWYCHGCGVGWAVVVDGEGEVEIIDTGKRIRDVVITLRLPPQQRDVLFRVDGFEFYTPGDAPGNTIAWMPDDWHAYFYNEHTCPSNIMRAVQDVIVGEDTDPHGLFEYVSVDRSKGAA